MTMGIGEPDPYKRLLRSRQRRMDVTPNALCRMSRRKVQKRVVTMKPCHRFTPPLDKAEKKRRAVNGRVINY